MGCYGETRIAAQVHVVAADDRQRLSAGCFDRAGYPYGETVESRERVGAVAVVRFCAVDKELVDDYDMFILGAAFVQAASDHVHKRKARQELGGVGDGRTIG